MPPRFLKTALFDADGWRIIHTVSRAAVQERHDHVLVWLLANVFRRQPLLDFRTAEPLSAVEVDSPSIRPLEFTDLDVPKWSQLTAECFTASEVQYTLGLLA
jgi:hypothetical protein